MAKVKSIKIDIGGKEIEVSPKEAEELHAALGKVCGLGNSDFSPIVIREVLEPPKYRGSYWYGNPSTSDSWAYRQFMDYKNPTCDPFYGTVNTKGSSL